MCTYVFLCLYESLRMCVYSLTLVCESWRGTIPVVAAIQIILDSKYHSLLKKPGFPGEMVENKGERTSKMSQNIILY